MPDELVIYIDGASQGNPGPSGVGVACYPPGASQPSRTLQKYVGETTNNVAEYLALIYALQEALIQRVRRVEIRTDSELLAKQVGGVYRVRSGHLQQLYGQIEHLRRGFESLVVKAIRREENTVADRLATGAVEGRLNTSLKIDDR